MAKGGTSSQSGKQGSQGKQGGTSASKGGGGYSSGVGQGSFNTNRSIGSQSSTFGQGGGLSGMMGDQMASVTTPGNVGGQIAPNMQTPMQTAPSAQTPTQTFSNSFNMGLPELTAMLAKQMPSIQAPATPTSPLSTFAARVLNPRTAIPAGLGVALPAASLRGLFERLGLKNPSINYGEKSQLQALEDEERARKQKSAGTSQRYGY